MVENDDDIFNPKPHLAPTGLTKDFLNPGQTITTLSCNLQSFLWKAWKTIK